MLSFLRRRGDPFGVLAPGGKQISTCDWRVLKAMLERAAVAWDPQPDATGVSHFRPEKLRGAEQFMSRVRRTGWASELERHYSGVILGSYAPERSPPTCARLPPLRCARVLICAAATTAVRGSPSTAPTPAGVQAHAVQPAPTKGGHPHGFVSQDQNTQGGDPVAEPVAGAGGERPPAGPRAELRDPEGSGGARRANARDRKPRRRRPAPT